MSVKAGVLLSYNLVCECSLPPPFQYGIASFTSDSPALKEHVIIKISSYWGILGIHYQGHANETLSLLNPMSYVSFISQFKDFVFMVTYAVGEIKIL